MTGAALAKFTAELEGKAQASFIDVTSAGQRLPDLPARFVRLSNWDCLEDLETANSNTVFWGFNLNMAHQLFPGDSSDYIPVQNCEQVFLRTRKAQNGNPEQTARVYFSYYA